MCVCVVFSIKLLSSFISKSCTTRWGLRGAPGIAPDLQWLGGDIPRGGAEIALAFCLCVFRLHQSRGRSGCSGWSVVASLEETWRRGDCSRVLTACIQATSLKGAHEVLGWVAMSLRARCFFFPTHHSKGASHCRFETRNCLSYHLPAQQRQSTPSQDLSFWSPSRDLCFWSPCRDLCFWSFIGNAAAMPLPLQLAAFESPETCQVPLLVSISGGSLPPLGTTPRLRRGWGIDYGCRGTPMAYPHLNEELLLALEPCRRLWTLGMVKRLD